MKKSIHRILIPMLVVSFSFCCCAQTAEEIRQIQSKTNLKKLSEFASISEAEYYQKKKRLELHTKQFGWLKNKVTTDGKVMELFDISPDNKPIYIMPLDAQGNVTVKSDKLYTGGGLNLNVHGEGMTVGIWDVFAVKTTHTALEGRDIVMDSVYYDPFETGGYDWRKRHATAVVGQIIASGDYNSDYTDPGGTNQGKAQGIAYKANALSYESNKHIIEANKAAQNGLLVSNHSYAIGDFGGSYYVSVARDFDNIMYFAPYYLAVWACGNTNSPTLHDQLNEYSVNKNGLAVANSRKLLSYTGPLSVQRGSLSSRGPSDDLRIKPDITAAGTGARVLSTKIGVENFYANGSGTSYASPTVAGGVLLLQQHYKNLNPTFMRSATVKGLILHTAEEAGPNPGPDITFGWGLMNLERAANAITMDGGKSLIKEDSLINGESFSRELVASGSEPLVATICWTDSAGTPVNDNNALRQLVNDLDVRLVSNGITYYPWKLDSTNVENAALTGDNTRDNVEKIEVSAPATGQTFTIIVNHKSQLAGNGQLFSLIVTGLEECVANRNINSTVNFASLDQQQASATITVQNTIRNGGKAIYHAADEVLFKDGFTGFAGAEVRAYLEGCTTITMLVQHLSSAR